MINNWFKLYLKHFWKNKVVSILNILGLAVGMTAVILVLLFWHNEHSYNHWNPFKERVYEVEGSSESFFKNWFPAPVANNLDKLSDIVEAYNFSFTFDDISSVEVDGRKEFLYDIDEKQANFFEFFPFETIYGSAEEYKTNYKDALAIDIDQSERLFGKGIDPIGKTVILENGKVLSIRFVYRIPGKSSVNFKGLTSFVTENQIAYNRENNWGDHNYTLLLKLKEGVQIKDVHERIRDVIYDDVFQMYMKKESMTLEEVKKNFNANAILNFNSLDTIHLNPISKGLGGGAAASKVLNIMMTSSVLLLMLSIINAVNLALVNSFKRAKEIGIRKAIGVTRWQLFLQFIFESIICVLLALVIALVLVEILLPYFNLLVNRTMSFHVWVIALPILGIVLGVVLLSGTLPSLFLLSFDTLKVLKGNYLRGKAGVSLRNMFLILQFVIAFFFLSTAVFIDKQVEHILQEDLGFDGDQVVNINFKIKDIQRRNDLYYDIESDLKKIKGVKEVTLHSMVIGGGYSSASGNRIGEASVQSNNVPVGYDFLKVFDGELKEGRFFDRGLATDSISKVVVNETFKSTFNFSDGILGKKIKWNGKEFEVIGVVKDMKVEGVSQNTNPVTYFMPNSVDWFYHLIDHIAVKIDTNNTQITLQALEEFWNKRIDSTYPIQYKFVNEDFAKSYQKTLYQRTLFVCLMGVSVFIALFGLMAIVSFSIESKLKEIAIRKVLGANSISLILKLSVRFVMYCLIGFIISIYPVIYVMNIWLEDFVYRISITVLPFVIAFVSLMLFSMLLVFWKAYKATRIDVLKYIKYE
ncbi:ABC transporter permease [Myroides profundi]|uniref:ABC transport system permease protein n=1 Tax=Myroides profundi TaxID=480520 RepID=A0AAJ4W403_MYRPR|nr:ABC transporter permease [Myroides profundi]AJH16542.1 putative ABC transport system permease protein [Myroides profundi]SEQ82955.1 putative ABC transport system permease protein [Myroides profundi]